MSSRSEVDKSLDFLNQLSKYDEEQILRGLTGLPYFIKEAAKEYVEADYAYRAIVNANKITYANKMREAIKNKETLQLTNYEDRKAWVTTQPEVIEGNTAELKALHDRELARVKHEWFNDQLDCIKKFANLLIESNKEIDRSQKYIG